MNNRAIFSIAMISMFWHLSSFAQLFTRVTATANLITTDLSESGGGSWIDLNNDSLLDLFVSNGNLSNENDFLYLNKGNGNFIKVQSGIIVNNGGSSIGSTWGDYDNDGFLDCFVTNRNYYGNFLYKGAGDTVFTNISSSNITTADNSNSSSWVDLDNDGDLDLYTVNFQSADFMFLNHGASSYTFNISFNPITQMQPGSSSIPGAWSDYNNDLRPDLFVGNSGTENDVLYINNGSLSFSPLTIADGKATLGASWGDYDNDRDLDLFVANFLNHGNILYNNSGAPQYSLSPLPGSVLSESANCVGSAWGDADNDGDLDLFVCVDGGNNLFYLNSGAPTYTFTKVTSGSTVTDGGNSFGCVFGDYDNDGQLDLFVANRLNQQNFLYHNNGNNNHWATFKCRGTVSNKSAIGTKVYAKAVINGNPVWQMQEVQAQTGYNSQNLWLHFGFGSTAMVDTLVVKWPSGTIDSCYHIPADHFYEIVEGTCVTISPTLTTGGLQNKNKEKVPALDIFPNPAKGKTTLHYYVNAGSQVSLRIIDLNGRVVQRLVNERKTEGTHDVIFDTSRLAPGIYSIQLDTPDRTISKTLVVE